MGGSYEPKKNNSVYSGHNTRHTRVYGTNRMSFGSEPPRTIRRHTYEHNANAKVVADIGEVDIEIPTNQVDVVKDSKTSHTAYKTKGDIDCLIN